jgi:hypothetical protein
MIEQQIKIKKEEKKEYPPIPENVYQCELLDITMKETNKYQSQEKENVLDFQFTLLNGKDKNGDLRGRNLWRNYVPMSLYIGKNGKNVLYQIIEAIQNEEMSPEQEAMLDSQAINSLIGKQVRVVVKNKPDAKGKIWSNIVSFLPIESELPGLTPEEKEKAQVKEKKGEAVVIPSDEELDEVNPSDIPF